MTNTNGFYDSTEQPPEQTPEEVEANAREAKSAERAAQAAHELAKLRRLLEHYARYREDNCSKQEWENVQQKRKEAYARKAQLELEFKAALEGDKNLPMVRPTLASTLDEIVRETERFLVIDHDDAQSIALWIVQTHVFLLEVFEHTPFLMVFSKHPDSGKSTLAELIWELSANVRFTASLTGGRLEAFLEREADKRNDPNLIKYWQDNGLIGLGLNTLLFDEADQYKATGLLGRLVNAAHRKRGSFWSKGGADVPCFAPIALFRLEDPRYFRELRTQVSRSILIEMKQRDPRNPDDERVDWYEDNRRRLPALKQQIAFLTQELKSEFKKWRPEANFLGKGNRRADNWRALVAIGDVAGGHWGETARRLAMKPLPQPEIAARVFDLPHRGSQREHDKARIIAHLEKTGGRCSRTDLYAGLFQRNLPSHVLSDYLADLVNEGRVRMSKEGRTEWIELAPPAPAPEPPPVPEPSAPAKKASTPKRRKPKTPARKAKKTKTRGRNQITHSLTHSELAGKASE
jgi:Protein of unknown function (DUF3631)